MKVIDMADRKVNAEIVNNELYHQLEPEANEIMFGQRTLPDRPLTDKEKSKRKKIILKLVDQKLKFQLIDLMGQVIEANATSNIASPSITTEYEMKNSMDYSRQKSYQSFQNWSSYAHNGLPNSEHNWQPQFQTEWHSSIYPQQYESSYNPSLLNQDYSFQGDIQPTSEIQNWYAKQALKRFRNRSNPNLVCPPINMSLNSISKPPTCNAQAHKATEMSQNDKTLTKLAAEKIPPLVSANCKQLPNQEPKSSRNGSLPVNQLHMESFKDRPLDSSMNWVHQTNVPICKQAVSFPLPSDLNAVRQVNTTVGFDKADDLRQHLKKRNRRRLRPFKWQRAKLNSSQNFLEKFGIEKKDLKKVSEKSYTKADAKLGTKANIETVTKANIEIGSKVNINDGILIDIKTNNIASASSQQCSGNISIEWNRMDHLVTNMCRNNLNLHEPLSPPELKLKNEILIQMSVNPISIRSNDAVAKKIGAQKLEQFINECKNILCSVNLAHPEFQSKFSESRDDLIKSLKAANANCISLNDAENNQLIQIKIQNIIDPILKVDHFSKSSSAPDKDDRNKLIMELMKNPHALEDTEMVKEKNFNKIDVIRQIKNILDEFIAVRPSKSFYLPLNRIVDIPFAVELHDKSGEMTEEKANLLLQVLHNLIDGMQTQAKPKIIETKFNNGTLILVCANRSSFEWIKKAISVDFDGKWTGAHLSVNILPVKNVIPKNALKTICLKFKDPQFFHFNNLMEQLKIHNPRLLTRRWELRPRVNEVTDSTKYMYVGVDIESLVVLEEMNRVGVLGKSLVYFEISYNDNEENFEINFLNEK